MISLDLSSTATWPRVTWLAPAQALTRCRAPAPTHGAAAAYRLAVDRDETLDPTPESAKAAIQSEKLRWNASGSSRQKTRRKVSCEGMPLGRRKCSASQSRLAWPYAPRRSRTRLPR